MGNLEFSVTKTPKHHLWELAVLRMSLFDYTYCSSYYSLPTSHCGLFESLVRISAHNSVHMTMRNANFVGVSQRTHL
jgi:hypothetical protein